MTTALSRENPIAHWLVAAVMTVIAIANLISREWAEASGAILLMVASMMLATGKAGAHTRGRIVVVGLMIAAIGLLIAGATGWLDAT